MMAERTLIVVTDCDLYKLGEEQRTRLIALLDDFPEYCCLIFVYDLVEYKPNKTYKKLYAALSDKAQEVRFEPQDKSDLINWIARRFRATGHDIDARTAEHLMFTCGSLMTGLVPEIEKIGAYAREGGDGRGHQRGRRSGARRGGVRHDERRHKGRLRPCKRASGAASQKAGRSPS